MHNSESLSIQDIIKELKHFLPAQAALKDFVHHNTLHGFQQFSFFDGLEKASTIFGYKVCLTLEEYREAYSIQKIRNEILERVIRDKKGIDELTSWKEKLITGKYTKEINCRIGKIRSFWKTHFHVDLDSIVHPKLFRILSNYLDQGISEWSFPKSTNGFFESLKELELNSYSSFFNSARARKLITETNCDIVDLLKITVGEEKHFEYYLFDQQFSHQGWSGIVSAIEDNPNTLLDKRKISLEDLIKVELLLEIDALDREFGEIWAPLGAKIPNEVEELFSENQFSELDEVLHLWHEAFEWSYYDEVLSAIRQAPKKQTSETKKSFQALFCIDDRECSLRRIIEMKNENCETFGTPGFFNVEFFFQPKNGKFYTKLCPAPLTPKFLIKEIGDQKKLESDSFQKGASHSLIRGWLVTQTLGIWSAYKLIAGIFNPKFSAAVSSSFAQMNNRAKLSIEKNDLELDENGLQIGFTILEMADRVEGLLKSIGLVQNFADIIYIIGHGASSINNPHYAAYDCGACCGRPGSVNARVASYMANKKEVREQLKLRGIDIPTSTQFVGGLHDTTRDEIEFFDENEIYGNNQALHLANTKLFEEALHQNAKERARRFANIDNRLPANWVHSKVKRRSVSLFEPRPEYNHATNSLCIIGRRSLTDSIFLDRRSFLNSYHPFNDTDGKYLANILKAAAPVCGGINLEYYFSRVDNQKLGAGSKLPHNVMGLIGVANGSEGDLRPGLPRQMIEIHDPVRLLMIIEQKKEIVEKCIKITEATYEWFKNEWINLTVVDPETKEIFVFKEEKFTPYISSSLKISERSDISSVIENDIDNLPVFIISK